MLVIVENGDIAFFLELAFDFEAARCGNILQIDAAEAAGDEIDRIHKFVHIVRFYAEREGIHVAEGLEQNAFSLHNGHSGLRADVPKAEDGAAVGDDGTEIPAARQLVAFVHVLLDLQTRLGYARRVGEGEIVLGCNGNGRIDFDFALPLRVQPKGLFCIIHSNLLSFRL